MYVQATAISLSDAASLGPLPRNRVDAVVISDGTTVSSMTATASYDFGGGHHNDSLTVGVGGQTYAFGHASYADGTIPR